MTHVPDQPNAAPTESPLVPSPLPQVSSQLAEALDGVSDVYVLYDRDMRIIYHNEANRAAMRTVGIDPDGAIGRVVTDVLPFLEGTLGLSETRRALRDRVTTTWEETYHDNLRLRGHASPSGTDHVVVMAQNITAEWKNRLRVEMLERRAAEDLARSLRWTTVQHALALKLAAATTPAEIATAVLESIHLSFGALWGRVITIADDGDTARVIGTFGHNTSGLASWSEYSVRERAAPVSHALQTRQALFFESLDDFDSAFPSYTALIAGNLSEALALLPVVQNERVIALISVGWEERRIFLSEERAVLQTMALQCVEVLQRAWAFDAEQRARTQAEEANRAKAQFLAAMSHELRTPLNAIGGYAELLQMGVHGPVNEQQRDDLDRIRRNQGHLLSIINDILNFARLEAAALEFATLPVPIRALVESIDASIAPQMNEKGLAYIVDDIDQSLVVLGDEERIRQALLNLLSNAVKFTPAGGAVRISCSATGDAVSVRVADTGIGIPLDRIGAIFDPFVQAHRSLTASTDGTGLGLAISRELARRMGGDVSVESVVEEGSIFTLTLPRLMSS